MGQAAGVWLADRGWLRLDAALVLGATATVLALATRGPRARRFFAGIVALAAGALCMAERLDRAATHRPTRVCDVNLEGRVDAVAATPIGWSLDLSAVGDADGGALLPRSVRLYGEPAPGDVASLGQVVPGERVRIRARLRLPRDARNPGARDSARRLARAGIGAVGRPVHPDLHVVVEGDGAWRARRVLERQRLAAGDRLSQQGPGGPLLRALAFGDRRDLRAADRDAFARLGIAHLLAVSGLHLSLLAAMVYVVASAVLRRSAALAARWDTRSSALLLAVVGAAAYAFLAGWGIPVRRALVFAMALALAVARGRPGARGQPLAAAAGAILAFEPGALFEPGAQLSFAASAALALSLGTQHTPPVVSLLRASATAAAVTAPLAAWHWGEVAPAAVPVNLVAIPWTAFVLLPSALAAAVAAWLDVPGVPFLAERVAALTLAAATAAEELVGGMAPVGPPSRPALPWLLAASALALLALRTSGTGVRVLLALAVAWLLALAPVASLPPPPPRVVFLDVGQGDATLVQGRDAAVLVDAGTALPDGPDLGRSAVVPALGALGVARLDLLIVTHADLDHRGGVPTVLRTLPVDALWLPHGALADPSFAPVLEVARERGVDVSERGASDAPTHLGDLRVTPLWPPVSASGFDRNDRSLVVRVEASGHRVLLPGDLEHTGEAALLASGVDLSADVLKLPHHGSRSSSSSPLLAAVGASLAVASAPCAGRFGMPHQEVAARARGAGLPIWWTGRDGAIWVRLAGPLVAWGHAPTRSHCRAPRQVPSCTATSSMLEGSGSTRPQ